MQRVEFKIEGRDIPIIALSALGGFLLVLVGVAGKDLATAILVGMVAGAPSGAGGGALACIFRRYLQKK